MSNKIKKLIVTDLDGTLLNKNRRVSLKTRRILKKLNKQGYMIVLASGRPWRSIKSVYRQIGCYGPVIAYNGSYVFHPKDSSFPPFLEPFPEKTIKEIYTKVKDVAGSFMCENLDTVFINQKDKYLKHFFWYKGMKMKKGDICSTLHGDPVTCIVLRPSEEDTIVDDACNSYGKIQLRHWTNSNYAELYIDGVDKGSAITYLSEHLNIDKSDIIGFGDADNDFPFLSNCGTAFAMCNTHSKDLLNTFKLTKNDNHHNGVALELLDILKD